MGTLGRAIRGVTRFEVGEKVDGDWAIAVGDVIKRVGPASAGITFPSGPRGGAAAGHSASAAPGEAEPIDNIDPIDELDALLDHASDLPPEGEVTFDDGERPLSILLIDAEEIG